MFGFLCSLCDRLFGVIGAFLGSQIPSFFIQYTQRLGGHVDELASILGSLKTAATESGKSWDDYLLKFLHHQDPDLIHHGEWMSGLEVRFDRLSHALTSLQNAHLWEKPAVFLYQLDHEIFKSTAMHFQPALTFSVEGLIYASIGLGLGTCLFLGIRWALSVICKKGYSCFTNKALPLHRLRFWRKSGV